MKLRIKLNGGRQYEGIAEDIIRQLKFEDWTRYNDVDEYKQNIKRRVRNFNGEKISYENDFEFLMELKRIGFIESFLIVME